MIQEDKGNGGANLDNIATVTRGFTGAELEGLVRSAIAFALADHQEALAALTEQEVRSDSGDGDEDEEEFLSFLENQGATMVAGRHFEEALQSVERSDILDALRHADLAGGRIVDRSDDVDYERAKKIIDGLAAAMGDSVSGGRPTMRSAILTGRDGAGRMTTVFSIMEKHSFEYIKRLGAHDLVGKPDAQRIFTDAFVDASRAPRSLLILDDLDLMVNLEPSIANQLSILLRSPPRNKNSMLVLATAESASCVRGFDCIVQFPLPRPKDLAAFASANGASLGIEAFPSTMSNGATFSEARLLLEQIAGSGAGSSVHNNATAAIKFWSDAFQIKF